MSWPPCPVCSHRNPSESMRCSACAADFSDPDVKAMMAEDSVESFEVAAGSLAHGKFLGVSEATLIDGSAVRKLAAFGALVLAGAFFIPIAIDFGDAVMPWKALGHAPAIALLFPSLAILMGLTAALLPLQPWQRSTILLAAGIVGLTTLPFLGVFSGSPEKLLYLIWLGLIVASWGLILRCYDSQSMLARRLAILGATLAVAGFFLPIAGAADALPLELRLYLRGSVDSASAFSVYKEAFNRTPMVFFSTVYLFLPLVLLPVAAIVAWTKPKNAWDKSGLLVRPAAWIAVIYIPLGFALFAFNLVGDEGGRLVLDGVVYAWDDVVSASFLGRLRLLLLAAVFATWATFPSVTLLKQRSSTETEEEG